MKIQITDAPSVHPMRPGARGLAVVRNGAALILLAASLIGCGAQPTLQIQGFDVSNASIPTADILSGGPRKDGIPAIDRPVFVPSDKVDFLEPDDQVVTVTIGDDRRAYPLRILQWHEIVNDVVGGRPVAVTYCPLCGTAMVFGRSVNGTNLSFGVSGLLFQSDVLMYDRQTESLWSQLAMKAVAGKMVNTRLDWLPSEMMTWQMWRGKGGTTLTLSTDTGHSRDYRRLPYQNYATNSKVRFPVPRHRTELKDKEWVLGVVNNGEAKAYPRAEMEQMTIKDEIGGDEIEIVYLQKNQNATVTNLTRRQPQPHVMAYWFAWQAFYPKTQLWKKP